MIRIYYLLNHNCSEKHIFDLINWTYSAEITRNRLKDIIIAIKNGKVNYWIKNQQNRKYEDLVVFYELDYLFFR